MEGNYFTAALQVELKKIPGCLNTSDVDAKLKQGREDRQKLEAVNHKPSLPKRNWRGSGTSCSTSLNVQRTPRFTATTKLATSKGLRNVGPLLSDERQPTLPMGTILRLGIPSGPFKNLNVSVMTRKRSLSEHARRQPVRLSSLRNGPIVSE